MPDSSLDSDYGSDFGTDDEATLHTLVTEVESQQASHSADYHAYPRLGTVVQSVEHHTLHVSTALESAESPTPALALPGVHQSQHVDEDDIPVEVCLLDLLTRDPKYEIEYHWRNRVTFSPKLGLDEQREAQVSESTTPGPSGPEAGDGFTSQSPLERFRTPPRKCLSVSDLVGGAWCELQYWYTISRLGKKRRTRAMKQGSSVHKVMEEQSTATLPVEAIKPLVQKALEEQLKTTVPIEVVTKLVQKALETEKRTEVPIDVAAGLVHRVLEKEKLAPVAVDVVSESVHKAAGHAMRTTVRVEVDTKEDAFGLRIWNVIQGLRTLRTEGSTRELEVWGVLDGEVVNGIIDELSYECPDPVAEDAILATQASKTSSKARSKKSPRAKNQPTMQAFLTPAQGNTAGQDDAWVGAPYAAPTVYLTDIKTRNSTSLPPLANQRPTHMQLMLYHSLLTLLATNAVPSSTIFNRYAVNPDVSISDSFIAQVASLDYASGEATFADLGPTDEDAIDELTTHNTLSKLWSLMLHELSQTFSLPDSSSMQTRSKIPTPPKSSLSPLLTAEYRHARTNTPIGNTSFTYDQPLLSSYLATQMAWWRGDRRPVGVDIEEAGKCRSCEFSEGCSWRKGKVEEGLRQKREKAALREEAGDKGSGGMQIRKRRAEV